MNFSVVVRVERTVWVTCFEIEVVVLAVDEVVGGEVVKDDEEGEEVIVVGDDVEGLDGVDLGRVEEVVLDVVGVEDEMVVEASLRRCWVVEMGDKTVVTAVARVSEIVRTVVDTRSSYSREQSSDFISSLYLFTF